MYFLIFAVAVLHCSEALLDCSKVFCALPMCDAREKLVVPENECCNICVPESDVPDPNVPDPGCATVSCFRPVCGEGKKLEVPVGQCCPICVPDHGCAAVSCILSDCEKGEKLEVPVGECCPICIPDTRCAAVICLRPVCGKGEKLEVPEGQCCPICVPRTRQCKIQGQEFSNCASPCPATCVRPNPICIELCVQGCKCPAGQVVDTRNRRCVPLGSCPSRENPCNRVDCQPNAVCKIFKPTGEAFCEPSCTLNNGGCQPNEICSLVVVKCVRAPCPPIIQCNIDPCTKCTEDQICKLDVVRCINPPCPVQARCLDRETVCSLSPKNGPCRGFIPRFFHNVTSGKCEMFIYGGCGGNDNNFVTMESCEKACKVPRTSPCSLILCPNGFRCEVLNGEGFCNPDCSLNNGGCLRNQTCRLEDVVCVRAPCPPTRICEDHNPCATVLCSNGFRCKVSNGVAFCDPDCSLNNGGCFLNQTCRLEDVVCVRAPCPPIRICEDRNPCATVRCSNGFRCKVSNGVAFCDPDCSLNNGGCLRNQTCRLEDVVCVRAPCPPTRICEDRNPCATVRCSNGFQCKVSNGVAFCDPDCSLNNGGCLRNQTCRLEDVVCVRAPCPPIRICEDRNLCATVRCANGFRCQVSKGVAFCLPDCSLNNGGCLPTQICRLEDVVCVLSPCPPIRICEDRNPCATVRCANGFRCKVSKGVAICLPDCSLNNGGCLPTQTCRLEDVVCVRAPCFPIRICQDRNLCSTVRCANGFRCKVSKGVAICLPDCSLNNGGCLPTQTCRLEDVVCVRAPCPPIRICEDRNLCATVRCANGFRCKFSKGVAFCLPDCSLNNGGCLPTQICRLEDVVCVRAPCFPIRICQDRNLCSTVRCANGFRCKVSKGVAFCNPDCNLKNGGCASDQLCFLKNVTCIRSPCPPIRICKDITTSPCPPTCSKTFCQKNRGSICSKPGPREIPSCTGSCQLTYCRACYFSSTPISPPPGYCRLCALRDYRSDTRCFRSWAWCINRAHREQFGHPKDRDEDNFRCYSPPCSLRG